MKIKVAGRKSPLSIAQIDEVLLEIRKYHPDIFFEKILMDTTGDLDLKTSLRGLDKTNFFTKEIDDCLLEKKCDIAIHSAKDLPQVIEDGLSIIAITKGVDSRDVLVLREGVSFKSLKNGALIGASSLKREEAVLALRDDFIFQDIRGTINKRLDDLNTCKIDGVVIAEAALIRLQLTHLNRIYLSGKTTALQGQLAILAHATHNEMRELFSCLDTRATF